MPEYRIYYDDGSTYDGPPEDAPAFGVQAIVFSDPRQGRYVLSQFDYYAWHEYPDADPQWDGHDQFGLFDYLASPGWKRVLFGRSIPTDRWADIVAAADADPDFPRRSATGPSERVRADRKSDLGD